METRGRPLKKLILSDNEREELQSLLRKRNAPAKDVQRARIVLLASEGHSNTQISDKLGIQGHTVGHWRRRFLQKGITGLNERPRSGCPRSISDEKIEEVIKLTLESKPKNSTHWSTRKMSEKTGISRQSIYRIWKAFALQPHRHESFTLSSDPYFVEKVRDVVGLYMNPPENALVFSVDEKSQIQALERSQPILPLRPGCPEQSTHDYFRHGTTTLFAALDVATGKVISKLQQRHRSREFLNFLKKIEKEVPEGLDIHLIVDNYATHKTVEVMQWLQKRPHWHIHFTPTHSSWLNQVERFFCAITTQRIRRDSFSSLTQLKKAINEYIEEHNKNPKPFKWTASADQILGKIASLCCKLQ